MGFTSQQFEQYQQEFLERCEQVEQGNVSPIDLAVEFHQEMQYLNKLQEDYKAWLNENVDSITYESEQYGKDGYKGLIFSKQTRETLSFKNIPEWTKVDDERKKIEMRSKMAWKNIQNGIMNVDADGVEIPLPEVKVSSFIKTERTKF